MAMKKVFKEMSFAGNLHLRFDEGEDAPAATPRRGDLLCIMEREEKLFSVLLCALAVLANCAKADIVAAQEHLDENGNIKSITVNDPNAQIGTVKTPWMFVRPDGKSGFANDFTKNAISVVSEDGTNYYAHVEDQYGDRTKVIHFTIDENGIPSKHGDFIDLTGHVGDFWDMQNRKLIGVSQGYLCFYPTEEYGKSILYNPYIQSNRMSSDNYSDDTTLESKSPQVRCLAFCQDGHKVHVLCNCKYTDTNNVTRTVTRVRGINGSTFNGEGSVSVRGMPLSDENRVMAYRPDKYSNPVIGDSSGRVVYLRSDPKIPKKPQLPGSVSGVTISDKGDIFVTSTATNAFFNLGKEEKYNVVTGNDGNAKPVVPKTNDGIVRIIDNRSKGGKLMCITTKGIHSMDD